MRQVKAVADACCLRTAVTFHTATSTGRKQINFVLNNLSCVKLNLRGARGADIKSRSRGVNCGFILEHHLPLAEHDSCE